MAYQGRQTDSYFHFVNKPALFLLRVTKTTKILINKDKYMEIKILCKEKPLYCAFERLLVCKTPRRGNGLYSLLSLLFRMV